MQTQSISIACRDCKRVPLEITDFANVYENVLSCFVVPIGSVAGEDGESSDAVGEGIGASSVGAETADQMSPASFEE